MSLADFEKEYHVNSRTVKAVICICQKLGAGTRSPVNQMLEHIQQELKQESARGKEVQVAYVYETPSLRARGFETIGADTPVYYKEPCERSETHRLTHIFFMGLALAEAERKRDEGAEYRVYLVTDEKFSRLHANEIICSDGSGLRLHPRFAALDCRLILVKAKNAGGDILEAYIRERGEVREFGNL